jgi:hypothetical protein
MSHRAVRVIPKISERGILSIPKDAWEPIRARVASWFDAVLNVHHHPFPGTYHGDATVSVPHYLLELLADDLEQINAAIPVIDEFVESLVSGSFNTERNTHPAASEQ